MNFTAGQRFTIRSRQGDTAVITVISTQELKNEVWVNVRFNQETQIETWRAIELAHVLMEQGNQVPLDNPQGLTPEQALAEFERRRAMQGPPAPIEPTIDQLPDLTDEQKAALAAQRAAAETTMSVPQQLVGQPSAPRQDPAAVEARIMGLPEPAPAGAVDTIQAGSSNISNLLRATAPKPIIVGRVGDWTLWADLAAAVEEWHKAQQEAITRRLTADEKRTMAMLDACEGKVPGKKLANEQARKAYVDEMTLAEEGRALRAEAAAKALQFWIERLLGGRQ